MWKKRSMIFHKANKLSSNITWVHSKTLNVIPYFQDRASHGRATYCSRSIQRDIMLLIESHDTHWCPSSNHDLMDELYSMKGIFSFMKLCPYSSTELHPFIHWNWRCEAETRLPACARAPYFRCPHPAVLHYIWGDLDVKHVCKSLRNFVVHVEGAL
jgi:hypothetical protein